MKELSCLLTLLPLLVTLMACESKPGLLPASGGSVNEVLVVTDEKATGELLRNILETPLQSLPQQEPAFDVTVTNDKRLSGAKLLMRNMVVTEMDPRQFTKFAMHYERDRYATPQLIVHLQAPDKKTLADGISHPGTGEKLKTLLRSHELAIGQQQLTRHHNPEAERKLLKQFGIDMRIPADMTAEKRGKDFIWLSNNATTGMQNICVFKAGDIDSVLRNNIKGETDSMMMQTVAATVMTTHHNGRTMMSGLWEMRGDAMGGPFVAHTLNDSNSQPAITILAFVYAPERKKRNLMQQLEAALYTGKLKH